MLDEIKRAYYESGKLKEETRYSGSKKNGPCRQYDENGTLAEVTTYINDKVVNRTLIKYEEKGNVSRISEYNIADKFGTTVNELIGIAEFSYVY